MSRQRPPSPKEMAALGWTRVDPRPWSKTAAQWKHRDGWELNHCGHPTANWPWALYDPKGRMHCTGLGLAGSRPTYGRAWPGLREAVTYVHTMGPQAITDMDRWVEETPCDVRWK